MKKILKKIVLGILFIAIYLNIGSFVDYGYKNAVYYPTSIAAIILSPVAPIDSLAEISPFSKLAPKVNKSLEEKYGSFENYGSQKGRNWRVIILFPVFIILIWFLCLLSWIIFLLGYLFLAFKFLFKWGYIIFSGKGIWLLLK